MLPLHNGQMPRFPCLAGLLLPVLLAACDGPAHPVFGDAVALDLPAAAAVSGPRFTTGPDGRLTLSWMESHGNGTLLRFASLQDKRFDVPATVVDEPRMFVNWADVPSVMHVGGEHWVAHWLRYSADLTYSYDVVVAQSFDGGQSWSDPVPAHTDGTPTEHGFVSMHRDPDGVALLWLDGRYTGGESGDDPLATSMTLRSAVIGPDGKHLREQLVDDSVCDCCQTDIAVAAGGPVAVYRDRTVAEVRDIYVSRLVDGVWQTGVALHDDGWVIPGCPVNGPSIVADGDFVAVVWFTAADNEPLVRLAVSQDSGVTFGAPLEIAAGRLAGYVGLAALGEGATAALAPAAFAERGADGDNLVKLRHVDSAGVPGPVRLAGKTSQLRIFPQIGYQDGSLYLAWTDKVDETRRLAAVRIPVGAGR